MNVPAEILKPLVQGFSLGAGLIIAIGSQNAFVLRQGLRREYVFTICTICFLCDALLILLGCGGFGAWIASSPLLMLAARWGGALFLFYYGVRSFRSAFRAETLRVDETRTPAAGLRWAIATTFALTLLNPHVYLDTVILLGSIAGQLPVQERGLFAGGAVGASLFWFYGIGYGARILTPLFRQAIAWKILDVIIGAIMWSIAASLLRPIIAGP
ncbi:MAG: amino acid transporter [Deltaproteobacteria bacterium HGW-Deltaproteobacteria-4]|nr:MAG: amino acid transporter [Deltaproteobacteria bacterium HGW-Deltaproteobacteria-4]